MNSTKEQPLSYVNLKVKNALIKFVPYAYGSYFNLLATLTPKLAAEKTFELFCRPRKGSVLPHQAAFLNTARDQVLHVNDRLIHTYRWPGSKETVLLLHGWESNSFRWRNLIAALQLEDYNIISIDAPAHGHSSGDTFSIPLYAECIEHIIGLYRPGMVVAHSMGGLTALYHQYIHPGNGIDKIVTLGSPSGLPELMEQYRKLLNFNNTVYGALEVYILERFGFGIRDFYVPDFVKSIHAKGLLIHDILDTITPISASEQVHASWENSTFIKTSGLGHSLHDEGVYTHIVDFLKS